MDAEILQGFINQAEEYLPSIRGGILVCARAGNHYGELQTALRQVASIKSAASITKLERITEICAEFEEKLKPHVNSKDALGDEQARALLDKLAEMEAAITEIYFSAHDFSENVSNFVEESFIQFERRQKNGETGGQQFEIDEEMLEIFALEADDLTQNIGAHLEVLKKTPESREALLEIRRSAHTLKGSAGIVGLKKLSRLAHRVEDLLDYLAKNEIACEEKIYVLLLTANDCFEASAKGEKSPEMNEKIERVYENSDSIITSLKARARNSAAISASDTKLSAGAELGSTTVLEKTTEQPQNAAVNNRSVVRVSLEKLDDLVKIVGSLVASRSVYEQQLAELACRAEFQQTVCELTETTDDAFAVNSELDLLKDNLESLFDNQRCLIGELQSKLLRLRMVSFGSLAARLQRTARVTCDEEEKIADLVIEGANLEIDTQILDGLVEPLLHLIRNAVAHGIEPPELRRLLGKPEKGKILLRAACEKAHFVVTISDDGRGISADALREKAVRNNFISRERADAMSEADALELMFLPGLTTAEKLSQVAGRGVGMNIVKTTVERHRGTISINSEARKGASFTIRLPSDLSGASVLDSTCPLKQEEVQSPNAADDERQTINRELTVLIVDDSPGARHAASNLVKNAGWQAATATNGLEALEILQSACGRLPQIILTDVEMPRMDGYEFLSALKRQANLREIPVVMITSRDGDTHRRKAAALGASEYLTKPYDDSVLLNKIKKLAKLD